MVIYELLLDYRELSTKCDIASIAQNETNLFEILQGLEWVIFLFTIIRLLICKCFERWGKVGGSIVVKSSMKRRFRVYRLAATEFVIVSHNEWINIDSIFVYMNNLIMATKQVEMCVSHDRQFKSKRKDSMVCYYSLMLCEPS